MPSYTTDFRQRNESYKESVRNLQGLTEELAKQATGITLYNPSDRVIVGRFGGQPKNMVGSTIAPVYRIPPEGLVLNTHTGKKEASDGTLVVYDDKRQDAEQLRSWRDSGMNWKAVPPKTVVVHTAAEVAAHLIRQNEHLGLCALTGDEAQREQQKHAAKARFLEVRKAEAQSRVLLAHKKAADAKALGMSYQWSADEVQAEQFLIETSQDEGQNRFVCRFRCGFWHYDEAKLDQHIEARHKDELAGEIAAVQAAERAEVASEEKRGRRKSA